ncbi:ribosomal protection-like ABC-F family protein [Niabella drilacis]|uniref:ATPase components of ABC transporters with duplicated ATPase domains n=1 Tax=Niabella drilacis (strain DSM 25811 / CCM 8410 / CCUG 62505 / LMG 26954 / E90) TaxID=1285928 RepID=A0A1G6S0J9_NIADE|nr:ABC-F family ATP-binding cassette domain-containing protein [Niabella drilacis]SDD09697.1 ATPase components of ABC transporters with duplicated ATPase domains [Niabella drilacis]
MLTLQNLSYTHPDKEPLFSNLHLTVNRHDKAALIGNNGAGKSTLLRVIAGQLRPSAGHIDPDPHPYYVPQAFGQYNHFTIARALGVESKRNALKAILSGHTSEENFTALDDDWTIEERCTEALQYWELEDLDLSQPMQTLSGGQKTKVFLAGMSIHQPGFILLDEPSNHLDAGGRQLLYRFIQSTQATLIVVSHDRVLLNLLNTVFELDKRGITVYGGNYDFYTAQKKMAQESLNQDIQNREKALRKAREKERETLERQQKLDARGKAKQEKAGVARIMMNTLRNNAERSTARISNAHAEKTGSISQELRELRSALPDADKMKMGWEHSSLHKGKVLVTAAAINYGYSTQPLWSKPLSFQILSGERIALQGLNGSGKSTLLQLITGTRAPRTGTLYRAESQAVYIDQDYSLINNTLSVYEQALQFNTTALQEHEVKIRLNRFLFTPEYWNKPCGTLSGGERMRLMLCCLTIGNHAPDIIILDEPTNNLDLQNIGILTAAVNEYKGTLIVVSHDPYFLEQIHIGKTIRLKASG